MVDELMISGALWTMTFGPVMLGLLGLGLIAKSRFLVVLPVVMLVLFIV